MSIPSASVRTGAYAGSVGANAISAPRNVGFSVTIDVAGVDDQLGREVEALLGALDDQDVVGGAGHAVAGEALGDLGAQPRQAVRRRVLQGDRRARARAARA